MMVSFMLFLKAFHEFQPIKIVGLVLALRVVAMTAAAQKMHTYLAVVSWPSQLTAPEMAAATAGNVPWRA